MTLNIVIKAEAPLPPYPCQLVENNPKMLPFVLYGIWLKSQKYFWVDADNWAEARHLLAVEGSRLLMGCGTDIVNAVDRVYNLLDVRLAGIERSVTGIGTDADPFVYDPPIEQAAAMVAGVDESLLLYAADNHEAWINLLNGDTSATYPDNRNIRQQLDDLILSVQESDDLDAELLEQLLIIAASLA